MDIGHSKLLSFFVKSWKTKNKLKWFLQRILQEIMKKIIMLGVSDAWLSCMSYQPSTKIQQSAVFLTHRIILKIVEF